MTLQSNLSRSATRCNPKSLVPPPPRVPSGGTFFGTWQDLIVLVDDGTGGSRVYAALTLAASSLGHSHPAGFGGLVIIPAAARPPSEQARRAMRETMRACGDKLACVCWVVEGRGFQAAMVRSVLHGLRFFSKPRYRAQVTTSVPEALAVLYDTLRSSHSIAAQEISLATQFVQDLRSKRHPRSTNGASTGPTGTAATVAAP